MIRKCLVIFCDNEHGQGDVTFPDLAALDGFELQQEFINATTLRDLRAKAKRLGWGHVNGGDYCPHCMENL